MGIRPLGNPDNGLAKFIKPAQVNDGESIGKKLWVMISLEKGGRGGLRGIANTMGRRDNSAEDGRPGNAPGQWSTQGYPPCPPSQGGDWWCNGFRIEDKACTRPHFQHPTSTHQAVRRASLSIKPTKLSWQQPQSGCIFSTQSQDRQAEMTQSQANSPTAASQPRQAVLPDSQMHHPQHSAARHQWLLDRRRQGRRSRGKPPGG